MKIIKYTYPYIILLFFGASLATAALAQTKKVLFLGNSYTQFNNLPELSRQFALGAGDTMNYQANTPGGYTFQDHVGNATSLNLIQSGDWNFVVLQEQSQLPAFPDGQFYAQSFPYAMALDSLIKADNPCAHTLFYRTWGRKHGDADNCDFFPPLCTYEGMDSMLDLRYTTMAEAAEAQISPVGDLWKYLRTHHPEIELYNADQSHPSAAGSFAAAVTFYTLIFGKDPTASNHNATLMPATAEIIRQAARIVVWDSLNAYRQYDPMPQAAFTYEALEDGLVTFDNTSQGSDSWLWYFGDGTWATEEQPFHQYDSSGSFQVCLYAFGGDCDTSVFCLEVSTGAVSVVEVEADNMVLQPNPVVHRIQLTGLTQAYDFVIIASDGRRLLQGHLTPNTASIPVADFSSGMYRLQLYNKEGLHQAFTWVKQ